MWSASTQLVGSPEPIEHIDLSDGRILSLARFGDPEGQPVLYFHGFPGSRLEAQFSDQAAEQAGVQIVAVDRPGFGRSTRKPGRRLLDWPDDVLELTKALGWDHFSIIGVSGGGPYAAACALSIPERLDRVVIVCGLGPLDAPGATDGMMRGNRILFWCGRYFPLLVWLMMARMASSLATDSEKAFEKSARELPEPDRAVFARHEVRKALAASVREAFHQGTRAAVDDALIYARPWGFKLEDVRAPVALLQGELDVNVPPSMGHYQATTIPDCRASFFPEDGHFSLSFDRFNEVIAAL